jgi:hypothetical protein
MQHEMRKNFRTPRGIRGFHAKHVTIHGNYNNAQDKLVQMGRKEYRVIFYSSSQGMKVVSYFYLISQLFSRNFYEELLNVGFLVILFLISIKFT